jgi:hypothetical protein
MRFSTLYILMVSPRLVSPFVLYMCHESFPENGQLIETGAGWAAKVRIVRLKGTAIDSQKLNIESVKRVGQNMKMFLPAILFIFSGLE